MKEGRFYFFIFTLEFPYDVSGPSSFGAEKNGNGPEDYHGQKLCMLILIGKRMQWIITEIWYTWTFSKHS